MSKQTLWRGVWWWMLALGLSLAALASAQAQQDSGNALLARHAALRAQLTSNAFQRPLHLESTQNAGDQQGDVYAVVDHPLPNHRVQVERSALLPMPGCSTAFIHL